MAGDAASAPEPGVRVGVTGHRSLAETGRVVATVDRHLAALAPAGRVRLTVVSSLAEGADRLVAERGLAHGGARLDVILPMPPEDYCADFAAASSAQFRVLLARADQVRVLRPLPGQPREASYEAAGRAVVDACDVLLALWDGEPAMGRGGTAEVVAYARANGHRVLVVPVSRGPSPTGSTS